VSRTGQHLYSVVDCLLHCRPTHHRPRRRNRSQHQPQQAGELNPLWTRQSARHRLRRSSPLRHLLPRHSSFRLSIPPAMNPSRQKIQHQLLLRLVLLLRRRRIVPAIPRPLHLRALQLHRLLRLVQLLLRCRIVSAIPRPPQLHRLLRLV
jgi:hypothetical protein